MLQDAAEGRRVVDFLLAYLDQKGSWSGSDGMLDATLGSLRKACPLSPACPPFWLVPIQVSGKQQLFASFTDDHAGLGP